MAHSYQLQLSQSKANLVQKLDFFDIILDLISDKIVNEEKYLQLYDQYNDSRISSLIEYIISSNEKSCEKFVLYLRKRGLWDDIDQSHDDNKRRALVQGNFPKLPQNFVARQSLVNEFREKVLSLDWNYKLVIHGITGYGKSCLTAYVLMQEDIMKKFDYMFFWLNLGEHQNTDNVISVMWRLYLNLTSLIGKTPQAHCPSNLTILKDWLKEIFLDNRLKNAILILDDVISSEVVDAFDFQCRIIITTQFKDLVKKFQLSTFIEVKTGFSLNESLELLKKTLNVNDLCKHANTLHSLGKGYPMFMALMASILHDSRDEAINNNDIWRELIEEIKGNVVIDKDIYDHTTRAITLCISKLQEDYCDKYLDLVLFENDVNIMPKVLQLLWGVSDRKLKEIMTKFANKSLVTSYYHQKNGVYIYGVHDLHLTYLKNNCKNIKERHEKLLACYSKQTGGDWAKLPHDNYILSYIGYHLKHAEKFEDFSVYFNLKFLETKIKAVNHYDVVQDFSSYKEFIERTADSKKMRCFTDFIKKYGSDLFCNKKTDIIQFALAEIDDCVHSAALEYIEKNQRQLYFKFLSQPEKPKSSIIKVEEQVTAACFSGTKDCVLIGTSSGKIFEYCNGFSTDSYIGHLDKITDIKLSPDKSSFLTISMDGTAKLWDFRSNNSLEIPSPKLKQAFWRNMHSPTEGREASATLFLDEKDDYIISADFDKDYAETRRILTGSHRCKITIWVGDKIVKRSTARGKPSKTVLYLKDVIIFSLEDEIIIFDKNLNYQNKYNNGVDINYLLALPDETNGVIAINDHVIKHWNFKNGVCDVFFETEKKVICATVSADGRYLIVGDEDHYIHIYDVHTKHLIHKLNSGHGLAHSLDISYNNDTLFILLMGLDNKTIRQYHYNRQLQTENLKLSTSYWNNKKPLCAFVTTCETIQVMIGDTLFTTYNETESEIKSITFSICGNKILYGLENGTIKEYFYKKNETCNVSTMNGPVDYLECFNEPIDDEFVSSFNSDNDISGLIVASSGHNLKIIDHNYDIEFIYEPLRIFYTQQKLLVVDVNCGLTIIDLLTRDKCEVKLFDLRDFRGVNAAIYKNKFLAVATTDFGNHYHIFDLSEDILNPIPYANNDLADKVTSMRFSEDGSQLAIGLFNGEIIVYNLVEFKEKRLCLHESRVESLQFTPEGVLISRADLLAWWCCSGDLTKTDWDYNKRTDVPYLLACVKLHGSYVKYFTAAKDYNTYLVVDNESNVYLIERLRL